MKKIFLAILLGFTFITLTAFNTNEEDLGTVNIETPLYGGTIRSIAVTDTHIFYAGHTTQTVKGYNLETGLVDIETPSYGSTIEHIVVTDTHIFYAGTQTVMGYNLETELVDIETPSYGSTIYSIVVTDTHIFYGGATTQTVRGYNLETELVDIETPDYGALIWSIAVTDTHIFYAGHTTQTVRGYFYSMPSPPPTPSIPESVEPLANFLPLALGLVVLTGVASYASSKNNVSMRERVVESAIAIIIGIVLIGVIMGMFFA